MGTIELMKHMKSANPIEPKMSTKLSEPIGGDMEASEPYKPGTTPGMEHVESMMDEMSPEEQSHAHKHLSDKMVQKKDHKLPGEHMDDFASAMREQS